MSEINNNVKQFDVSSSLESVEELNNTIASETTPKVDRDSKKMDWQKVAHKLREYNRKLLKEKFKLEQDLADIEDKFKSQTEKSQSSDRLVAKQAEEIKEFQEQIADLSKQLKTSQQVTQSQKELVENLSQQLTSSQKQTASLERECALLQESYNDRSYQLTTKTKQVEELSTRLSRQQQYALQYKSALDDYLKKATAAKLEKQEGDKPANFEVMHQPIKAWSSPSIDTAISLPITQTKTVEIRTLSDEEKLERNTSKVDEWPSPAIVPTKTAKNKKSGSLAAVKLPRFPRK